MRRKVLFIVSTMDIGGVQSGIMNFAKLVDKEKYTIDVLNLSRKVGFHEKEFNLYGNVFHMPIRETNINIFVPLFILWNGISIKIRMIHFLKKNKYDVVHSKSLGYSASASEAAKIAGVKVRITQCHVDAPDHLNRFHRWYYKWCARRIEKNATCKLAVSPKAANLMYGEYGGRVIKNPTVDLSRFNPQKYEAENLASDEIRLIHIGTYSPRKNQIFSINILKSIISRGYCASLTFIGYTYDSPGYEEKLHKYVKELGLSPNVRFLPKDSDIPLELSQCDYMLIPSLREGLPNVALEAQAMGVRCLISDNVNKETDCGLCAFLPLKLGYDIWAQTIIDYKAKYSGHKTYADMSSWDNRNVVMEYTEIWDGALAE